MSRPVASAFLCAVFVNLAAPSTRAEVLDAEPPRNAITIEPLAVVFARAFAIEYERLLTPGWSFFVQPVVVFGASRVATSMAEADPVGRGFSGLSLGVTTGARLFVWGEGLEGMFLSAFFSLAHARSETEVQGVDRTAWGFGAGAMVGYTFLLGEIFDLSFGLGASYFELRFDSDRPDARGVHPALRLAVGAAF